MQPQIVPYQARRRFSFFLICLDCPRLPRPSGLPRLFPLENKNALSFFFSFRTGAIHHIRPFLPSLFSPAGPRGRMEADVFRPSFKVYPIWPSFFPFGARVEMIYTSLSPFLRTCPPL